MPLTQLNTILKMLTAFLALILASQLVSGKYHRSPIDGSTPLDTTSKCPPEWYPFGEKCYKGFGWSRGENLDWEKAAEMCSEYGVLVSIHSEEEQDFLTTFILLNMGMAAWIGLHDRGNESVYEWEDGSEMNFKNWNAMEPSGSIRDEDCVEMVFKADKNVGKWNDHSCNIKKSYICQMYQDNRYSGSSPMFCESAGYFGYSHHASCYLPIQVNKNWDDAENYCIQKHGGHLVTINSFPVKTFLDYILNRPLGAVTYWIGIKDTGSSIFRWASGWLVSYSKFEGDKRVQEKGGASSCAVRKKTGYWDVRLCEEELPFICEVSTSLPPPPLTASVEGSICPEGDWKDLGGDYCYIFQFQKSVSWYKANFDCMTKGGTLMSIHSFVELQTLIAFLMYSPDSISIGLFRGDDGNFRWADGSMVEFYFWNVDEPNNKAEKCVEIIYQTMFWNDMSCQTDNTYVCSTTKIFPNTTIEKEIQSCTGGVPASAVASVAVCVMVVVVLFIIFLYFCRPWEKEQQNHIRKISHDVLQAARPNASPRNKPFELIVFDDTDMHENIK